jgi:hypothetical protein
MSGQGAEKLFLFNPLAPEDFECISLDEHFTKNDMH